MSVVLRLLLVAGVMGLAFWAYREDDRTRLALREMERVERAIVRERRALAVLDAEWAYLNRPDRLRDLARLNDAHLRLAPLTAEAFGRLDQVPRRPQGPPAPDVVDAAPPMERLADAGPTP